MARADNRENAMLAEASACDDCLTWHKYCEAECCLGFIIQMQPAADIPRTGDEVRIQLDMSDDVRRYLELHRARIEGNVLVVPVDACSRSESGLYVSMRCSALRDDLLCSLHPDRKPEGCGGLDWETAQQGTYWLSPRCLYTYKLRASQSKSGRR